jgi:glucans biosynthesis protein
MSVDRRRFSALSLAAVGASSLPVASWPGSAEARIVGLEFGPPAPFGFPDLIARARALAAQPYVPTPVPSPAILEQIDYDAHGKIKFRTENAPFSFDHRQGSDAALAMRKGRFPVTLFHLGRFFQKPQRIHVLESGMAREIVYREDYFDMPDDSPAHRLPKGVGFAGFRFQEAMDGSKGWRDRPLDWRTNDWVAFLGASYFRAIGDEFQYGLSARGIMVNAAVGGEAEEFPDFTHVWLDAGDQSSVTAYCLLNGPSITGAYRFVMRRDRNVTMDIEKHMFVRRDIARLGVAPLTSMYWYSEAQKPRAVDWRPEIHDSDGLALWTGAGERIWRPLNNPSRTIASSFSDENPRGFALMQRDRAFDRYLDGVFYERRPSLWVEPQGRWGRGSVQLIEIPTDDEIHDNIVAAWVPEAPVQAGQALLFSYRLHWQGAEPFPGPLATVVATRLGNGGQPGTQRPQGVRKFVVEFKGDVLKDVPFGARPEVVLAASRGSFSGSFAEAVPNDVPGHWRAVFDLTVGGGDPVEMRAFLKIGDRVLTETWLYQYHPL